MVKYARSLERVSRKLIDAYDGEDREGLAREFDEALAEILHFTGEAIGVARRTLEETGRDSGYVADMYNGVERVAAQVASRTFVRQGFTGVRQEILAC